MTVLNKHVSGVPAGAVYIGRGSKWGNPFVMLGEGTRDKVCEDYEQHLNQQIKSGEVTLTELAELDGKDLVCFCSPKRCHGHTLERAAAWAKQELAKPVLEPMNLIVAGGRDFNDYERLSAVIFDFADKHPNRAITVVSGMARGADKLAWEFCRRENVKCIEMPADWDQYGKRAGYIRNEAMADISHALIAFWDGKSRGTKHMIDIAYTLRLDVQVEKY
ncbi:DUF4326 domain-containing protein [Vreelandella venusta]|uniref:DUF4326 domain-containing protein n=1 Tax=Vreelandella venusta TaxID=44935 RepID=UPI00116C3838|nr:DUF4326 domain-containing protein [Halomonas venusta]GEK52369.1 hypothetical protein HVE01_30900 [Halomonas venusta]